MSYAMLLIILCLMTLKGYCGKKCAGLIVENSDAYLFNFVRMSTCTIIGIVLIAFESSGEYLMIDGRMLLICLASAVANVFFLVGWMFAIERNAMVTVDVTLTIGSIIPALLCALLFSEVILLNKMIGFLLIVIAAMLLSGYNGNKNGGKFGWVFLIIAALGDGMIGFIQQLYVRYCSIYPKSVFHFYTYLFSGAILLIAFHILKKGIKHNFDFQRTKRPLPYIAIMSLCMFAVGYLQTLLVDDYQMSSQILYPFIKGGCLITVTIVAMLFFGEKPTKKSIFGTLIALFGVVVLNS